MDDSILDGSSSPPLLIPTGPRIISNHGILNSNESLDSFHTWTSSSEYSNSPPDSRIIPENSPISPPHSRIIPENSPISPPHSKMILENFQISPSHSKMVPEYNPISPPPSKTIPENSKISPIQGQGVSNFAVETKIPDQDIKNNIKFEDAYTSSDFNPYGSMINEKIYEVSRDEIETISQISQMHNNNYKSINFGEPLIKELLFSSICGVPLSAKSCLTAYRLMIQRIKRAATEFSTFKGLNFRTQTALLKNNADFVVSLRAAVFFEKNKQGLDQIVLALGINDYDFTKKLITDIKQQRINRIEYNMCNSLQKIDSSSPTERRFNKLVERVGTTISVDENLITLLSYVLLFSTDFAEEGVDQNEIVNSQETMIRMLQRYVFGKYPRNYAINLFAKVLNCVSDLQELCSIKKQRIMVADPKKLMEEEQETDQEKL